MGRKWVEIAAPKYSPEEERKHMKLWMKDMDRAWLSPDGFIVYSRILDTGRFIVEYAVISRDDDSTISWSEKQAIKNELFGEDVEAIEIYTKEYDRTCSEGEDHLWLLSENTVIPFGLNKTKMKVVSRNCKRNPIGFVTELAKIMGIG